jgi:hypothetical protein
MGLPDEINSPDAQNAGVSHAEKIAWMYNWARSNGAELQLQGQVGFGRECVGITISGAYPDCIWFDDEFNRLDQNGDIWEPEDAYEKHSCVAVIGRGEKAESQLYDWLRWFDANGFVVETGMVKDNEGSHSLYTFLYGWYSRMVKKGGV